MKTQAKPTGNPLKTRSAKTTTPAADDAQKPATKALQVHMNRGETQDAAMARCVASPTSNATVTVYQFHPLSGVDGGVDINALQAELGKHALEIREGDMARPEAMLVAQAHSLDAIFNAIAQRAARNIAAGYLDAGDRYFRMALKAQAQCRTTIEALVELKNPTGPTFVKQQNIAQNQQVNNGPVADSRSSTPARAHEKDITPTNELLEASHGERLDTGATCATGRTNQDMETVGAVNRTKD